MVGSVGGTDNGIWGELRPWSCPPEDGLGDAPSSPCLLTTKPLCLLFFCLCVYPSSGVLDSAHVGFQEPNARIFRNCVTWLRNTGITKSEVISSNNIISYIRKKVINTQNSLIPNDFTIFYCSLYFLGYLHLYSKYYIMVSCYSSPVNSISSHVGGLKLAGGGSIATKVASECC